MRVSSLIAWSLVCALAIFSFVLWGDLGAERKLVAELRVQQDHGRVAAAQAVRQVPPAIIAAPTPATVAASPPSGVPAPQVNAAMAARVVEAAQRENALLAGDVEYRKARLARARNDLETRYPNLARDLGMSAQDADFLFTVLAESEVHRTAELAARMANGSGAQLGPEVARVQQEQDVQLRDAIAARLGAARYTEVREYQETEPSRQRVATLGGALTQGGASLTDAQAKSLTTLIIAEQRRKEAEARSEPPGTLSGAREREFASNRRILAAVQSILDPPQVAVIKGRFDRAEAGARATTVIQQRTGGSVEGQ